MKKRILAVEVSAAFLVLCSFCLIWLKSVPIPEKPTVSVPGGYMMKNLGWNYLRL